ARACASSRPRSPWASPRRPPTGRRACTMRGFASPTSTPGLPAWPRRSPSRASIPCRGWRRSPGSAGPPVSAGAWRGGAPVLRYNRRWRQARSLRPARWPPRRTTPARRNPFREQDAMNRPFRRIAVVGAGAMGRGIAQLFAQSGFDVVVHDTRSEAIDAALAYLRSTFDRLAERGKMSADEAHAGLARVTRSDSLDGLAGCDLVIEAVVERLDVKQALFGQLEAVCAPDAVLATNTSSLSVTAIASACKHPGRITGYHFFNPVPLMKVVEVVRGAATEDGPIARLVELARIAGHRPVVTRDYPGVIVNHAGRAYGPESIRVVSEGGADRVTVDRILREQVSFDGKGFKLGPFELLDLTGLDVSHPVMESIYRQFYDEPRFRPSVLTAQHYAAGWYGRKTGMGFYRYENGEQQVPEEASHPEPDALPRVWIAPGPAAAALGELVEALGGATAGGATPADDAMVLVAPLGIDATTAAEGYDARRVVAIDTLFPYGHRACKRRVIMGTPATTPAMLAAA